MKSLEEFNRERRQSYIIATPTKNGIACPKCGNELVDTNPNVTLTIYPSQTSVHCLGCDYRGYRIA